MNVKGNPNYWNLYAKANHTHDNYVTNDRLVKDSHRPVGIPKIGEDGVFEVGQYLDMHTFENGKPSNDNDVRLMCSNPNNYPEGQGNFHVTCREATLGNSINIFKMGYDLAEADSGMHTNKNNMSFGSAHSVWLKSNNFFDGANDIHYNKSMGASQFLLSQNNYPRFRSSASGNDQWGTANWGDWHNVLTTHNEQRVVYGKGWGHDYSYDYNYLIDSGVYAIDQSGFANKPQVYNYGVLVVFNSAGVICQLYIPHNSTYSICWRVRWYDGNWTGWKQLHDAYSLSTLEEKENIINELEQRISALEYSTKSSYNKRRKRKTIK